MFQRFSQSFNQLWKKQGWPQRLGLAISGGVDSMALASLCAEYAKLVRPQPAFTGFIVDHKLRNGSTAEAEQVAAELERLKIQPQILTLDWTRYGDPSSLEHIESLARTLRYQALGRACYQRRIESLLVAHHADDQAETVLLRIVGKYYGSSLRGIKPEVQIPECNGIYGVHGSGTPRHIWQSTSRTGETGAVTHIEDGGVTIARPLLPFPKNELSTYCERNGIKWFEDKTNADPTFTMRNTIRYLQSTCALPEALQEPSLQATASRVTDRISDAQAQADELSRRIIVKLDMATTTATFEVDDTVVPAECTYLAKLQLVQKLLTLVSPDETVGLSKLHSAAELVFPEDMTSNMGGQSSSTARMANVVLIRTPDGDGKRQYLMRPAAPMPKRRAAQRIDVSSQMSAQLGAHYYESDWKLWDNRYWIRIRRLADAPKANVMVRFLQYNDIVQLRKTLSKSCRERLHTFLERAPKEIHFTLPAIIALDAQGGERVVALPSVGWSDEGWQQQSGTDGRLSEWQIRYKKIDFPTSDNHTISALDAVA